MLSLPLLQGGCCWEVTAELGTPKQLCGTVVESWAQGRGWGFGSPGCSQESCG